MERLKALDDPLGHPGQSQTLKDLYQHLIIRRAIRYQEDWVAWCEEALNAIDQVLVSPDDE